LQATERRAKVCRQKSNAEESQVSITSNIETITPRKAKQWLDEANVDNRNMRNKRVSAYARDIANKNWALTGDAIRFNGDGTLIDGQHRLAGCVEAGKAFKSFVMRGLPSDAKFNIDTGAGRSFSDTLKYLGHKRVAQLAATIRWNVQYERGALLARDQVTVNELLAYLDEHPDIVDAVNAVGGNNHQFGSLHTIMSTLIFRTKRKMPGEANAFYAQILSGEGLKKESPVFALRRFLEWNTLGTRKALPAVTQAIVIKAFNAWIEGREVKVLAFKPGGKNPEAFPVIRESYFRGRR
jgi:hypothetical protein